MEELYFAARTTANTAELYWDKPDTAGADAEYHLYVEDKPVVVTNKTHWTLTGLQPEHSYRAKLSDGQKELASIIFTAGKIRRRIDVTKEPYCAKG